MSYKVNFVGLVCFFRERGTRLALLPDGREPGDGIDPHYASISVSEDAVEEAVGWEDADDNEGVFLLPPCDVIIGDVDQRGDLDTTGHDGRLPQLRDIDGTFEIDPASAQTIAKVRIARGKLTAFHIPEGKAAVSQLEVEDDREILISVKPDDGSPVRTIRIKAGTEIAMANMAEGGVYQHRKTGESHFRIYEKLSVRPVRLSDPQSMPQLSQLQTRHPLFTGRGSISIYVDCSNTGCC